LAASYKYDPYGNTITSSGTNATANVYRFSSKEVHVNSGMYYYGYRFYDPNLQRWLNRDPYGEMGAEVLHHHSDEEVRKYSELLPEGHNLYTFVRNNPVSYKDLWGLKLTPQDCEDFKADCFKDISALVRGASKTGAGKGVCVAGAALAAGKKLGKGAGAAVGGAGSLWALIGLGRNMDAAIERKQQCTKLYNRCLESVGLL
jgi:RHS repeat-associated protein